MEGCHFEIVYSTVVNEPIVDGSYRNYMKKAEEMPDVAVYAANESKNNAAVTAAIHCAINAIDSLAVFYFGKRHSGRHEDAIDIVKGAVSEK